MEGTRFFRRNIIFYFFIIILIVYIYGCGLFANGTGNIQRGAIPILSSASKITSFAFLNRNILYFSTDSPKFYKYIIDKNEKIQIQFHNDIKRIDLIKKIEIDPIKSYIHTLVESEDSGEINWEYYIYNINQSSWKKIELVGNKVFDFLLLDEKEVFFKVSR